MNNKFPLTAFQKSIWRGQLLHKSVALYNMIFTFDIHGPVDKALFEKSFEYLVSDTASLRSVVDEQNMEEPIQRITDQKAEIEFLSFESDSEAYDAWRNKQNTLNFDLSKKSYYSALVKLGEDHHVWYINQHHIFCDAYCFQLMLERLTDNYLQLADHKVPESKDLAFQQKDKSKDSDLSEVNRSVFRNSNQLVLYGNKTALSKSTRSRRMVLDLPPQFTEDIQNKIRALQLNTFAPNLDLLCFLMSALVILIKQIGNGQNNIQLSNIFSTRISTTDKKTHHPFLKILDCGINSEDGLRLSDIYKELREFFISQKSGNQTSHFVPSIISNMFHLQIGDFAGMPTTAKWHHCDHVDNHHFLRFHIFKYRSDGPLQLAFDLKEEFFQEGVEQRLPADYLQMIKSLCQTEHDDLIDAVCLLSVDESLKLNQNVKLATQLDIDPKKLLLANISENLESLNQEPAIYFKDEVVSYGMLKLCANNISHYLEKNKLSGKKSIVLYLPRSPEFLYAMIGSLQAGNSFVPVPQSYPIERLQYIAKQVDADLIIHDSDKLQINFPQLNIHELKLLDESKEEHSFDFGDNFYTLFTSGSTGSPKGVSISHEAISHYILSTKDRYLPKGSRYHMPLFTSTGFDLTMSSIFLPLATGGSITIFPDEDAIDLSIRDVIREERINCYKCTPSHLKLIEGESVSKNVKSIIVGGENFLRQLCLSIYYQYDSDVSIINEYGPTEATIGCIAHFFDPQDYTNHTDVVIGQPLNHVFAFIANSNGMPLPQGAIGELCIGGKGLAKGYVNNPIQSEQKFKQSNAIIDAPFYRTGDVSRINEQGDFEFFGRNDHQISVGGIRVEKGEIENVLKQHKQVDECVVLFSSAKTKSLNDQYVHCVKCGLPSNYPEAGFNDQNICKYCQSYDAYKSKVEKYFKTPDDFKAILDAGRSDDRAYDCLMLFSGGKDSSYALGQIAKLGYKVLAFTLDNGYISESAKMNIKRIVDALGVDHIFGHSPHMNEIFVDSLKTHCNVCNGCFKTIYNLSLQVAYEKNIPAIITGLTRGQFFETKLSEEIFWKPMEDASEIDQILFEARKAYHSVQDITYDRTNGKMIESEEILNKIKIVDFYRYHDTTLEELLDFINTELPWVRPGDTGRSTNCLINKVGIYVHKQKKGYSNYAFPYSWDVRTGHKTKEEAIDEIEEPIIESEVLEIVNEIGYKDDHQQKKLSLFYTGESTSIEELKDFAGRFLPDYMIPSSFVKVDQIPLTNNGKVDREGLLQMEIVKNERIIVEPQTELEQFLLPIWQEVIGEDVQGVEDDFFALGGTSLDAIRICSRIEKSIGYRLSVSYIFEKLNISKLAAHIEEDMRSIMN